MAKLKSNNTGSQYTYSAIEDDVYEARLARFVLVGMQPQRAYEGKAKPDAILAKCGFELIGETVTVTDKDGNSEERPAMVFYDIVVPAGGCTRGKLFDMIQALGCGEETFHDSEEYKDLVGLPLMVDVGHYTNKDDKQVTCVNGVSKMTKKNKANLDDLSVDPVFFCCYTDSDDMKQTYAGLGKFLQDKMSEASDKDDIPAVQDQWETSLPDDGDKEDDEF